MTFTVLALIAAILVLAVIVRFSIVLAWRTRGASHRLARPDVEGVERVCGFPPPADLVHPRTWFFGGFYPLTASDVLEQRRLHRLVSGIPIADDLDKGVYFVDRGGRVLFRPAGRNVESLVVAESAEALSRFDLHSDTTTTAAVRP